MPTIGGITFGSDLTEKLFGVKDLYKSANTNYTPAPQSYAPSSNQSPYTGGGSVLGTSTSFSNLTSQGGGNSRSAQASLIDQNESDASDKTKRERELLTAQIDQEFNSLLGQYGAIEKGLQEQLPLTEQQISQSYNELLPGIESEREQQITGLAGQQSSAEQQTAGTLAKARQTYNELLSGASRFGGSAQEAFGELLGRQTAQTVGEARQNLANAVNEINAEKTRVNAFFTAKTNDLEKSKNLAIEQARQDVRDEMAKINAGRLAAGEAKANKRLEALYNYQNQIAEIRNAAMVDRNALDLWRQQRETTLAKKTEAAQIALTPTNLSKIGIAVAPGGAATYQNYLQGAGNISELLPYLRGTTGVAGATEDNSEENLF